MICDGAKVTSLRKARIMTQEKLAAMANVDRRTVQRIEAGEPVALETIHQVAAPLGVTAFELRLDSVDEASTEAADGGGIHLKAERSGIRLVEAIVNADEIDFAAAFEPWPEQIEAAGSLLRLLEDLFPRTHGHINDYDTSLASSAAARMEAAAKVNAGLRALAGLQPEGLHVLFGQYSVVGHRWNWDHELDAWSSSTRRSGEVLTVAALRMAPVSKTSLRVPIRGKPVPPTETDGAPF